MMKTNFKGTVKEVKINVTNKMIEEYPNYLVLDTYQKIVCLVPFDPVGNISKHESDAKMIKDAFKVRQQINFDLPELLEQRNQLIGVLEDAISGITWWSENFPKGYSKADEEKLAEWRQLLNKIQQDHE